MTTKITSIAKNGVAKGAANGASKTPKQKKSSTNKTSKLSVSLQEKVERFEILRGLGVKRERLVSTLARLKNFTYNQDSSVSFYLKDGDGQEFSTSNNELVEILVEHLTKTLNSRKEQVENDMLSFDY